MLIWWMTYGIAVDFSYQVQDRDRISIYPSFQDFDVEPTWRVSPEPLPAPRFVLDGHLGRLARYLRLLGLDSAYDVEWTDPELVEISTREDRTLLTSDRGLLMHGVLTRGYFVRAIRSTGSAVDRGSPPLRPHLVAGCVHQMHGM